jgi:hypothetical protein
MFVEPRDNRLLAETIDVIDRVRRRHAGDAGKFPPLPASGRDERVTDVILERTKEPAKGG